MLTRKFLARFRPYSWEPSTREIAASMSLKPTRVVRMDTNTSPFLPKSVKVLSRKLDKIPVNEYPDTSYLELREALSSYCDVSADNFVITSGADEALDIVSKTMIDSGDEVIVSQPTYSMFRVVSEVMGAKIISAPRKSTFELDIEEIIKRTRKKTKVIFLCNPNNPTGNSISHEDVKILSENCGKATIVVDEAYFEFSGKTVADLALKQDNIVVVRTFSKAFSMAGARVGYIIAREDSVRTLNKVRPPNSLSVISLALAHDALRDIPSMRSDVRAIIRQREKCIEIMRQNKRLEVFPSEANFILFRVIGGGSSILHSNLMKKGYVLRNFSTTPGVQGCLRVTVNKRKINENFLALLPGLLKN